MDRLNSFLKESLFFVSVVILVQVIVGTEIDLVKHDAIYVGSDRFQTLFDTPYQTARTPIAMGHNHYSINQAGNNTGIGKRDGRRRINHDMIEALAHDVKQNAHLR